MALGEAERHLGGWSRKGLGMIVAGHVIGCCPSSIWLNGYTSEQTLGYRRTTHDMHSGNAQYPSASRRLSPHAATRGLTRYRPPLRMMI